MSTTFNHQTHTISDGLEPLAIRAATAADRMALLRLAQRDSAAAPAGTVLVAESRGAIRAALALESGRAIADPFQPTADLVALLRARAAGRASRRAAHSGWSPGRRSHSGTAPRPSPRP